MGDFNMKYIVLLRGINISGKNKISMSELKVELSNYYEDVIIFNENFFHNLSKFICSGYPSL